MKTIKILMIAGIAIVALTLTISAEEGLNIKSESVKIEMPVPEMPDMTAIEKKSEPIPFQGGVMLGNIATKSVDGKQAVILSGSAAFILGKDNAGGVLKLTFADPKVLKGNPADVTVSEFPLKLNPADIKLDGAPMEIEIAPGRIYISISLTESKEVSLSKVEFIEKAKMLDSKTNALQVKLAKSSNPGIANIQNAFKIAK